MLDKDFSEVVKLINKLYMQQTDCEIQLPLGLEILDEYKSEKCQHEWVNYVGLTECFQYCKKCDEKREYESR